MVANEDNIYSGILYLLMLTRSRLGGPLESVLSSFGLDLVAFSYTACISRAVLLAVLWNFQDTEARTDAIPLSC